MIDLTVLFPNKRFLQNNFAFSEGDNNISTTYDDGTVFKRQKTTNAPVDISGQLLLSAFELNQFRNFYKVTTSQGTLPFYFKSPLENSLRLKTKMYFLAPPEYQPFSGLYWFATMNLRLFENDTI